MMMMMMQWVFFDENMEVVADVLKLIELGLEMIFGRLNLNNVGVLMQLMG